jgi:PQQ-like domain
MFTDYKQYWTMFRGNIGRTGTAKTKPLTKALLYWTIELGRMISSPVFERGFLYIATLTGRIFCLDILRREIKWHQNMGSPIVSSPLTLIIIKGIPVNILCQHNHYPFSLSSYSTITLTLHTVLYYP